MNTDEVISEADRFGEVCRERGWKRTAQRRTVFAYLEGNKEHPSVETVWANVRAHLPEVSLDSIYRILDEFTAAGLIRRLECDRVIRYDSDTSPHAHFLCYACGRMFDFHHAEAGRVAELCGEFGIVTSVELSARGICRACSKDKDL